MKRIKILHPAAYVSVSAGTQDRLELIARPKLFHSLIQVTQYSTAHPQRNRGGKIAAGEKNPRLYCISYMMIYNSEALVVNKVPGQLSTVSQIGQLVNLITVNSAQIDSAPGQYCPLSTWHLVNSTFVYCATGQLRRLNPPPPPPPTPNFVI